MSTPIYIPRSSLDDDDIRSLVNLCLSKDKNRCDTHGGRKVAFKYLTTLKSLGFDLSPYISPKEFEEARKLVEELKNVDLYKQYFDEKHDKTFEKYWELKSQSRHIDIKAKNNRKFTEEPFKPEQLKVYFNTKQIENILYSNATYEQSGFVDDDVRKSMQKKAIIERNNQGHINTIRGRIEEIIFTIPSDSQIIVLDFADERMPGGLFLNGATTQEETICYNSNTYRALLDFKYERFDGGFFIPEFGCLYIKHATFYDKKDINQTRKADIIAAACYDLTKEHGLFIEKLKLEDIEKNTEKKFETIIASAQANSDNNGVNTYLILGPIGCGAFANNIKIIAKLWAKVLRKPLNEQSGTKQYHAFKQVLFLSGKGDKLEIFEQAFDLTPEQRLSDFDTALAHFSSVRL